MAYTSYEAWDHGEANTTPWGDENGNIVGVELEIGSLYDAEFLDACIDEGLIETADSRRAPIQLEREAQSDVQYELIFNADTPANVMARLAEIEAIGHDVSNHHETSCHVHINRAWLNQREISELDFFKAAEAIAPLIFKVSGRNRSGWDRWTPSKVDINMGIIERFQQVDDARPWNRGCYDDRYELCNCINGKTLEIRGFSNYFDFDLNLIALYIAIADTLIPDLAEEMKGRKYADEWERVLKMTAEFLKGFETVCARFDLGAWLNPAETIRQYKREQYNAAIIDYQAVDGKIQHAKTCGKFEAARLLIVLIENYDFLELDGIQFDEIGAAIADLEDQNNRHFKNAVWRS